MPTGGTDGENVPKRCVTYEHVPFTVYTFSGGVIMRVRLGCLRSSMILYSDSKQSAAIPLVSCPSDLVRLNSGSGDWDRSIEMPERMAGGGRTG
jgi:hypothetical protein